MTPAIAAVILGGILLVAGFQGRNVVDVALGRDGKIPDSTVDEAAAASLPNLTASPQPDTANMPSLSPGPQTGNGDAVSAVIAECNRITSLHKAYAWAGGHIGYNPNGPWDCSGAVSQVLHHAGLLSGPPRTSGLFMAYGDAGPGKYITICANPAHVFLIVNGRVFQTSHENPGGGPGWTSPRSTSGFTVRHPRGY